MFSVIVLGDSHGIAEALAVICPHLGTHTYFCIMMLMWETGSVLLPSSWHGYLLFVRNAMLHAGVKGCLMASALCEGTALHFRPYIPRRNHVG